MADFTALKTAIQTYIKQNGNEEITGEILQEVLLSMVTTLGDSAINNLVTALNDEVAARQNADGTLQQNITNEATARGNADTALGGRIDDEATARANGDTALSNRLGSTITAENTAADQIGAEAEARAAADTALQGLIDGITENIENGYVYAGIATPSSTPATGKVFYLALTAGTYTNFDNTEVSQGINILKYNGSAWSLDAFIGVDDEPTAGSENLVKSGGVAANLYKNASQYEIELDGQLIKINGVFRNLVVGQKYILYASAWDVSDIEGDTTTVLQFYYNDGSNHIILKYRKNELPEFIKFEFIAQFQNYNIQIRGNEGSYAKFYCREYDEIIDGGFEQIGAEAEARAAADAALQGLIDGITDNIKNGYVYAGIATPSSTPATGKVFYLALTEGTYTNFGSTEVSQGINILKYNGSAWSLDVFIGVDDEPTAGSKNLVKSGGMKAGGGSIFSITGNGTTVVEEANALKGLTIGKTYHLYAKKWAMSEVDDSQNVIQLTYYQGGTQLVTQINKSEMSDVLDIKFTAVVSDYKIKFRGDTGTLAAFKIREYDYSLDPRLDALQENVDNNLIPIIGKATSSDNINKIIQELYSRQNSFIQKASTINSIKLKTTDGGSKQIVFYYSDETHNGFTIEEVANGVYKISGNNATYVYIKNWRNYDETCTVNVSRLTSLQANPVIAGYLAMDYQKNTLPTILDRFQEKRDYSIIGNGTEAVVVPIEGLAVGKNYCIFIDKLTADECVDDDYVLTLKYGSVESPTTAIELKKRATYNYVKAEFVAQANTYSLELKATADSNVTIQVSSSDIEQDFFENRYLQNEYYTIDGRGGEIVQCYGIVKGLIVGEKYILYAPKWNVTELSDTQNALQFFYNDGSTHLIYQVKKQDLPDIIRYEFIAQYPEYSINVRCDTGSTATFQVKKFDVDFEHEIEIAKESAYSYWTGKELAWYGTSIPYGGYPQIVGGILGATIKNYARGSSRAVKGNNYTSYEKDLGHTIAEKIAAVNDMWTIDDVNQTFTIGPRTMGITGIPDYTTYAQVKYARMYIITASYEVVILARTLLSDETERRSFLQNALGTLYDYMMTNYADRFEYHDTDLWVLDHGHNDNCGTDPSQIDMSQVNLTSFVGAMNYYIGLIYQYKPHARICIVSDYDDFDEYTKKYTIETQKAIAERWHLPFIPIHKYLPFNINTKIRTRGYWDADGVWHDTGFVWGSLNGNMIGNGHFNDYIILKFYESGRPPRTIEELTVLLNPSQDAAGNWWYDLEPRYVWLFDGLHPHSVAGGYALKMYAEPVAELLKEIGTNGY